MPKGDPIAHIRVRDPEALEEFKQRPESRA